MLSHVNLRPVISVYGRLQIDAPVTEAVRRLGNGALDVFRDPRSHLTVTNNGSFLTLPCTLRTTSELPEIVPRPARVAKRGGCAEGLAKRLC